MGYDLEKYRHKREKVLGIKKKGISFGTLATLFAIVICLGFGIVTIPRAVAYFGNRNLDDAIYRLTTAEPWPDSISVELKGIKGVREVHTDKNGTRLIVTFEKTIVDEQRITALFKLKGIHSVLLNRVGHAQRMATLNEEAELETP